jgi:thiosulfate dehydrogenase [quinone] large subunit
MDYGFHITPPRTEAETAWKRVPSRRPSGKWGRAEPPRNPEHWLALLRILTGLWFLRAGVSKLEWNPERGIMLPRATAQWIEALPDQLAGFAATSPFPWYRHFLENVAIPQSTLFAHLTALGEAAIGVALLVGFVTATAAVFGALLVVNYGLASMGQGPSELGYHLLLFALMIAFAGAAAGRTWGLDALFDRRRLTQADLEEQELLHQAGGTVRPSHFIRPGRLRRSSSY